MNETFLVFLFPLVLACGVGCAILYLFLRFFCSLSEAWVAKHPEGALQVEHVLGIETATPLARKPAPVVGRPVLLGVITILGIAGAPLAAVGGLVELTEGNVVGLATLVCSAITFFVSIGLRKGSYAAWVVIQILYGLSIFASFPLAVIIHPLFLVPAIPPILLLIYFHCPAVKQFCHAVAESPAQASASLAPSNTVCANPDREPPAVQVLASTTPESRPPPSGSDSIGDEGRFVCHKCRTEWPTNYCPLCATTIRC